MSQDTPAPEGRNLIDFHFERDMLGHMPQLKRYAMSLTKVAHKADDLVQDTFLKAWKNRDSFTTGTYLFAWMKTIMRNEFLSALRKSGREVEGDDEFWQVVDAEHSAVTPAVDELIDLDRALQELPDDKFAMILHADILGNSYQTISMLENIPEGTVKSRIYRSREYLQALLGEAYQPAGQSPSPLKLSLNPRRKKVTRAAPLLPLCIVKETVMDVHSRPDDIRHSGEVSVLHLAAEVEKQRYRFMPLFKQLKNDAGITHLTFRDALEGDGIHLSLQSITNMFNGKGVWNERRLMVFLRLTGKKPHDVLAMVYGAAPEDEAATEPAAAAVPEPACEGPAPSTIDQMYALVTRLLDERLARGDAAGHANLLGDLIHRLTR